MASETLNQIASVIKGIAPTIATVFGGPGAGALVGLGLNTLGKFLGIPEDSATAENVLQAAQAAATDPEIRLKIMAAENDFALKLKGLELEELKAALADVQSAREREKAIVGKTGKLDINLYVLAWVMVVGFFILTGMMYFYPLPKGSEGPINQLFGAVVAGLSMVLGYFFGSSKGSHDKDQLLLQANSKGK
jgi:hypothetical protein